MEIWRKNPTFPDYLCSSLGRIKRTKILTQQTTRRGYLEVKISISGKTKTVLSHRLIAEAFLGDGKRLTVNHLDGNKQNNRIENLQFCTDSENKHHATKLGLYERGSNRYNSKLTESAVLEIRSNSTDTHSALAKKYKVTQPIITRIKKRQTWRWLDQG